MPFLCGAANQKEGVNLSREEAMSSDATVKTLKWGVRPSDEIVSEIELQLTGGVVVVVVLDKNYPTSMSSEGFEGEIKKLSEKIGIPHEVEFTDIFRAVFKIAGKEANPAIPPLEKGKFAEKLSNANEDFAIGLYLQILKENADKNIVVSPLSIATALAVVYNGASGGTEKALGNLLCLAGMNVEEINRAYDLFLSDIKKPDPKVDISIANSVWTGKDRKFREDFIKKISVHYEANAKNIDFNSSEAVEQINRWVNEKTKGKISEIVDESIKDSILLIINAMYFKGIWREVFEEGMTKEDAFYLTNGREKRVHLMFQEGRYNYLENEKFQAISLPYGHGRIGMYIFLPDKKANMKDFYKLLNQKNWRDWMSHFKKRQGRIGLPRFREEYGADLNKVLSALGMQTAFSPGHANFERIFRNEENIFISRIKHKTYIEVNEKGTEAGASAAIEMLKEELPTENPFTMIINRPFFFVIRDNESGMPLFMGSILEPNY